MKRIVVLILILASFNNLYAQQAIKVEDAAKHEGDSVTICTRIFGGKYFESSKDGLTLLNAGAKYPDAPLTIVIYGANRPVFNNTPETYYTGKNICVTGKIIMFKEKPEIIISKESQLTVKE